MSMPQSLATKTSASCDGGAAARVSADVRGTGGRGTGGRNSAKAESAERARLFEHEPQLVEELRRRDVLLELRDDEIDERLLLLAEILAPGGESARQRRQRVSQERLARARRAPVPRQSS